MYCLRLWPTWSSSGNATMFETPGRKLVALGIIK